ncbi:TetR/AcrR family transcriptional regulator [Spongiactinospora sp. 9N601]|uniref:TetR/AcrR family transcriptional regulator n=1 Tax=Spongiactinospora sp. 9N601 TaxID=3375149 RepID=UPI0037A6F3D6
MTRDAAGEPEGGPAGPSGPGTAVPPMRSHARANRARILAVARRELSANPDATIDEIARAAGVVRRTLYAHFPGRPALLAAIADEAAGAMRAAIAAATVPGDSPAQALARHTMELWRVGDRYRTLLALGHKSLGDGWFEDLTEPALRNAVNILRRAQAERAFGDHLPAEVLAAGVRGLLLELLQCVNSGLWQDAGPGAAVAVLIGVGVDPHRARETVATL